MRERPNLAEPEVWTPENIASILDILGFAVNEYAVRALGEFIDNIPEANIPQFLGPLAIGFLESRNPPIKRNPDHLARLLRPVSTQPPRS